MKLCDYGCGREAKYSFKNGKWCCEHNANECPTVRREHSKIMKEVWKKPGVKEKHSKTMKEIMNQSEVKRNLSKIQNKLEVKIKKQKAQKKVWKNLEYRTNQSKIKTFTIEQIQDKYSTFSKEEEMRYDSNGEIQVHCKYNECKNSKEKGGWFNPTPAQFAIRKDALEHDDGNDGCYFYCSEDCKQKCCLFNIRADPNILKEFEKYHRNVDNISNLTFKKFHSKIKNSKLRGKKHGYSLDHKYSIFDGFNNNVDPEIISHWSNLECIPWLENSKKNKNSSITLEELKNQINEVI